MIDTEKRMVGGWWIWILLLLVITSVVFGVLNAAGIIGRTVVEREVFERSFQFDQARQAEIDTYTAQIAELDNQLRDPALDDATKGRIRSQLSALRVRLNAAEARRND